MARKQRAVVKLPRSRSIRSFRRHLLHWYSGNGRRFPWRNKPATTYQRVIAEVLLQRTRAETVGEFYRAFIERFPSWRHLSLAAEEELRTFLKPIGLWLRRAASLRRLAQEMNRRRGRFPRSREEIEALPGVGQYIANAIQLVQWHVRSPLLDVNMARVLERYFGPRQLADIRYDPYLQKLARRVVDSNDVLCLNWAMLDLGAMICRKRSPKCQACPCRLSCNYARGVSRARDD